MAVCGHIGVVMATALEESGVAEAFVKARWFDLSLRQR